MRLRRTFASVLLTSATLSLVLAPGFVPTAEAQSGSVQSQIDAHNAQIDALKANIAKYQSQLVALGKQKSTLQSAIATLTLSQQQISANLQITQNQIASANLQIKQLGSQIGDKESEIASDHAAVASSLKEVDQTDDTNLVEQFIAADHIIDAWTAVDQAGQFNRALDENVANLRQAKTVLATNRDAVTAKQKELTKLKASLVTEQNSLAASKKQQQTLLAQTKNSESGYQKLLAQAQAELASFSTFATGAGGAGLLGNQTVCDDWGCYYNQRDSSWGNVPLSGTHERFAAVGCLVSSMAMVLTHYGYNDVNPMTINANSGNFSAVGGLLLATVYVDGVSATRVAAAIDATLGSGNPAIVGIHAYGGTHFVVLTSGAKGSYLMRDPYIANGKDISFTAHYSLGSIYQVNKVVINK
jgi:peptidoglycan hydrolase CwlO-like protein